MLEAFRVFDKEDRGFISVRIECFKTNLSTLGNFQLGEFKSIMVCMGDKLSEEEFNKLVNVFPNATTAFQIHSSQIKCSSE